MTFLNHITENAHIIQYADDCLLLRSVSESDIGVKSLQESIVELEIHFSFDRSNFSGSETESITFCRKND